MNVVLVVMVAIVGAIAGGLIDLSTSSHLFIHLLLTSVSVFIARALLSFGWVNVTSGRYFELGLWFAIIYPLSGLPIAFSIGNIYLLTELFNSIGFSPHWLWLLGIPAVISGLAMFAVPNRIEREQTRHPVGSSESRAGALEAAKNATLNPGKVFLEGFWGPSFYFFTFLLFIVIVWVLVRYFGLMSTALVYGDVAGWVAFLSPLLAVKNFMISEPRLSIAIVGIILGVNFIFSGLTYRRAAGYLREFPGHNRDLSDAELSLIETETARIAESLENRPIKGSRLVATFFAYAVFWSLLLSFIFSAEVRQPIGFEYFQNIRVPQNEWFMYIDEQDLLTALIAIYAGAAWGYFIWSWLQPGWAGFNIPESWKLKRGHARREVDFNALRENIAFKVRSRWISEPGEVDALEIIDWSRARGFRRIIFFAVLFSAITVSYWFAERMHYALITEERIEYRNYFSLETKTAEFSDIEYINVECRERGEDKNLNLTYGFHLSSGDDVVIVGLVSEDDYLKRLPSFIIDWIQTDALARRAGAMPFYEDKELPDGEMYIAYDREACVTGLDELVGVEMRKLVIPMLEE